MNGNFSAAGHHRTRQTSSEYKGDSVKDLTKKGLLTHLQSYIEFCDRYEFQYFPSDNRQMCRFGQHLIDKGFKSADSVRNYISGIRTCHALLGFQAPPTADKQMEMFLAGIKNVLLHDTKQAAPISPELLLKMYHVVDFTDEIEMVAWVALLVGFTMFLRRSNLVPEAMDKFQSDKQFTRADFNVTGPDSVMMAEVRWSKTIQFKQRVLRLPILPVKNKKICPVTWMNYMISHIPGLSTDPLFLIRVKGKKLALSANQLILRMRKWLRLINEDPEKYSIHSLRRGGATFASQCNIRGEMIRVLGDWASDAWKRYCDISMDDRFESMQSFVDGLDKLTA